LTISPDRPLGRIERTTWMLDQVAPLGMGFAVRVAGPLDPALLRRALDETQARHPLLRVRVEGGLRPSYASAGVPAIPLRVVPRRGDDHWAEVLEDELAVPIDWRSGPLLRVLLLPGSGAGELLFLMHHIIGDGHSLIRLAAEVAERAAAIVAGRPCVLAALPVRPPLERALAAGRGIATLGAAAPAAARLGLAAVRRAFVIPSERPAPPASRRTRFFRAELEPGEMDALAAASRSRGTTVHGAICAAAMQVVLEAFASAPENRAARVICCASPVNMRPFVAPPVTGEMGLFIVPQMTTHPISAGGDFWALAGAVRRDLAAAIARGEPLGTVAAMGAALPPPVLARGQAWAAERAFLACVTVSNMGRVEAARFPPFEVDFLAAVPGMNAVGGSGFAIATLTMGDRSTLVFSHAEPLLGRARAEALAAAMLRRLRSRL
jgi:hypothetical protein